MTKRISFRELSMADCSKLYEIYSDKEAMKYRGSKPMQRIEDARTFVKNRILQEGEILTIRKGVELVDTKELIGSVMYRFDENQTHQCEIGYSIGQQYWGQALGKTIVANMLKVLEENNKIKEVIAWSNQDNIASIKILEKLGFEQVEQNENQGVYLYLKRCGG